MKYFLLIFSLIFVGCTEKQVFIKPLMHNNIIFRSGFSENSFYVYVSPKVEVLEFVKTFNNRFDSGEFFSNYLRTNFENRIGLIFDKDHQSEIVNPLYELEYFDEENFYDELQSIVKFNDIQYLILIQNTKIFNSFNPGGGGMMVPAGGGMSMMIGVGGSTENCVIEYEVQLIDVESWQLINDFIVTGEKEVGFFNFESALIDAISNSVSNTIYYFKTGEDSNPNYY